MKRHNLPPIQNTESFLDRCLATADMYLPLNIALCQSIPACMASKSYESATTSLSQ